MTNEDKDKIDAMSHEEMAKVLRFTELGAWPFDDLPLADYFLEKFSNLGGMTEEISKKIGWE